MIYFPICLVSSIVTSGSFFDCRKVVIAAHLPNLSEGQEKTWDGHVCHNQNLDELLNGGLLE
jgi:hypothetical protein